MQHLRRKVSDLQDFRVECTTFQAYTNYEPEKELFARQSVLVFELNFIITTTFLAIRFVHLRSEHSIFFSFAVNWKVFYFVTMQVICYFRREEFHSSSETRNYSFQFSKVE